MRILYLMRNEEAVQPSEVTIAASVTLRHPVAARVEQY